MSGLDHGEFRTLLESERERLRHAVEYLHPENAGSMEDEVGDLGGHGVDNHLADMASATYDRELDQGLEETAQDTLGRIDAALGRIDEGTYGICELCGGRSARSACAPGPGRRSASTISGGPVDRARERGGRRPGRLDHERAAGDLGGRALARRGVVAVGGPRVGRLRGDRRRPDDEVPRHVAALARPVGHGRRAALDPSRAELRHRLRALPGLDGRRRRGHLGRRRLDGRLLRAVGLAPSRVPGRARAAARAGASRTSPTAFASVTSPTSSTSSTGRRSTSPTASSWSASRSCCSRSSAAIASPGAGGARSTSPRVSCAPSANPWPPTASRRAWRHPAATHGQPARTRPPCTTRSHLATRQKSKGLPERRTSEPARSGGGRRRAARPLSRRRTSGHARPPSGRSPPARSSTARRGRRASASPAAKPSRFPTRCPPPSLRRPPSRRSCGRTSTSW